MWRSLAARSVRDAEVRGSNPLTPTNLVREISSVRTKPDKLIGLSDVSYFATLFFSPQNAEWLQDIAVLIAKKFGDAIFVQPAHSLHINIVDFIDIATDITPSGVATKDELWDERGPQFEQALAEATEHVAPFTITFNEIGADERGIYIKGHDQGQIAAIRKVLVQQCDGVWLPGTQQPADDICVIIAHYQESCDLTDVQKAVAEQTLQLDQRADTVYVTRQSKMHVLTFKHIAEYELPI